MWCGTQALGLCVDYKAGQLLAYQLLCTVTLRRHDMPLPTDHLLRFYIALHHGLTSNDQVSAFHCAAHHMGAIWNSVICLSICPSVCPMVQLPRL